jgi:hypothetical protein
MRSISRTRGSGMLAGRGALTVMPVEASAVSPVAARSAPERVTAGTGRLALVCRFEADIGPGCPFAARAFIALIVATGSLVTLAVAAGSPVPESGLRPVARAIRLRVETLLTAPGLSVDGSGAAPEGVAMAAAGVGDEGASAGAPVPAEVVGLVGVAGLEPGTLPDRPVPEAATLVAAGEVEVGAGPLDGVVALAAPAGGAGGGLLDAVMELAALAAGEEDPDTPTCAASNCAATVDAEVAPGVAFDDPEADALAGAAAVVPD